MARTGNRPRGKARKASGRTRTTTTTTTTSVSKNQANQNNRSTQPRRTRGGTNSPNRPNGGGRGRGRGRRRNGGRGRSRRTRRRDDHRRRRFSRQHRISASGTSNAKLEINDEHYMKGWVNAVASPFKAPCAMGIPSGDIERNFCTEYNFTVDIYPTWKLQKGSAAPGEIVQTKINGGSQALSSTLRNQEKVNTVPDGCMVFSIPSNFAFDLDKEDLRYWQDMINTQPQTQPTGQPIAAETETTFKSKQLYKFLEKDFEGADEMKVSNYENWYRQSSIVPTDPDTAIAECRRLYPRYVPICRAGRQFFNGWTPEQNPAQLPSIVPDINGNPNAGTPIINNPPLPKAHNTRLYDYPNAGFTRRRVSSGKINVAVWYHIKEDTRPEQSDVKNVFIPMTQDLPDAGADSGRILIPIGIQALPTSGDNSLVPHTTFDDAKILNCQMTGNSTQDTVNHRTGLNYCYQSPRHQEGTPGYDGPGMNYGPTSGEPLTNIYGWSGEIFPDGCHVPTKAQTLCGWRTQLPFDVQIDGTSKRPLLGPINWPFTQDAADGVKRNTFSDGVAVTAVTDPSMEAEMRADYLETDECFSPFRTLPSRHVGGGFKLNATNQIPGHAQGMYLRWGQIQRFIRGYPVRESFLKKGARGVSGKLNWPATKKNAQGKPIDGGISIRDNFKFNYANDAYAGGEDAKPGSWKDIWENYTSWESYFNRYPQVSGEVTQSSSYETYTFHEDGSPSGVVTDYPATLHDKNSGTPQVPDLLRVQHLRYVYSMADLKFFTNDSGWRSTSYGIPWCMPLPAQTPVVTQTLRNFETETRSLAQELTDIQTIEADKMGSSVRFDDADALEDYIRERRERWETALKQAADAEDEKCDESTDLMSDQFSRADGYVAPRPKKILGRDIRRPKAKRLTLREIMEEQLRDSTLKSDPGHFRTVVRNGIQLTDLDDIMEVQKSHCVTAANIVFTGGEATGKQTPTDAVDVQVGKNLGFTYETVNIRETHVDPSMYWPGPSFGVPDCSSDAVQMFARAMCDDRAHIPGHKGVPGFPTVKKGKSFWDIAKKGWGFISNIIEGANSVKVVVDDLFTKAPGTM